MQCLRTLRLDTGIDIGAIAQIGRLSSLQTLHLVPSIGPLSLAGLPQGGLFHHLRSFSFRSSLDRGIQFVTQFVRSWANPPLRSFEVEYGSFPTAAASEELYRALSHHCSLNALETLKVEMPDDDTPAEEQYIISGQAVKLLFCFTSLKIVSIISPAGFLLDDATITELASAWPQIEELHLAAHDHMHQCGSLLALHAFARHCPNLRSLELSFDALSVPPPDQELYRRQQLLHPALTKLNVAFSLISHAFSVARFISATFFNVTELVTALEDHGIQDVDEAANPRYAAQMRCHILWKDVEELLPGLNDIRAEFHWGEHSIDQTEYFPFEFNTQ
ncbi:hypothetical protein MVEN_01974400 [Mycena venus]|uniref:F-box domain-containing protein n=1 Tax=Mycena venus TaxID=2733690 RepID=A0A8H7CK62_9AGAR|nr:hypothetical protein MVEN_01974400 [Mycena venus]